MPSEFQHVGWLSLALGLGACATEPVYTYLHCLPGPQTGDEVSYDPAEMGCVALTMAPGDYTALSNQYRFEGGEEDQWPEIIALTAMSCSEPYPSGYTYFPGDIKVDGWAASDVGIRRKGFIGSVVDAHDRPSFKVKVDEYVEGQQLGDTERVTLNNNHQDFTRTRTCLTYSVFEDAGYPAPRCNLANVSMNGFNLGAYSHVEDIKKRFLRREFGNDSGSLYEGTMADFTDAHLAGLPDNLGRFEAKTGETDPTGAHLRELADALQVPDEELEGALDEVIDLDSFLLFWALETVVNHNDGYNANTNNFYVYFDPDRGDRAVFIPWGADQAFYVWPQTKVTSELARRISRVPALHQRYLDELEWVVEEVWDVDLLHERIDAFAAQVATAEEPSDAQEASAADLRAWVDGRRADIEDFIAAGGDIGLAETGACSGSTDAADFTKAAELVSGSASACSAVPGDRAATWWVLLLLGLRRRAAPRGAARGGPGPSR